MYFMQFNQKSEAALQSFSEEQVFRKYAVNLLHVFRISFPNNTSEGLPLKSKT